VAEKLEEFIQKLEDYRAGKVVPFVFILDDPSGNSYLENPNAPAADPQLSVSHYERTREQNQQLGITQALLPTEEDGEGESEAGEANHEGKMKQITYEINKEGIELASNYHITHACTHATSLILSK